MPQIAVFDVLGGPENLKIKDAPTRFPGQDEVKLRLEAAGLNRAELLYMAGHYYEKPQLPSRVGYEVMGVVEAVGPGVDSSWIGKRVGTVPGYSMNRNGALGEEAVVPAEWLVDHPQQLSAVEGASVWMQYLTAYSGLMLHGKLAKGEFVLLTAASSSVGLAAIQIAKAEGATAIATTRHGDKREALLAQGADHVIATEEEDLPARVREITSGKLPRIVFDPVGGPFLGKLVEAAAPGGMICEYGVLAPEPATFSVMQLLGKGMTIRGLGIRDVLADPAEFSKAKQYVLDRLSDGRFLPIIAKTFPLAEASEAYRYLASNQQVGKVAISVP